MDNIRIAYFKQQNIKLTIRNIRYCRYKHQSFHLGDLISNYRAYMNKISTIMSLSIRVVTSLTKRTSL